MDMFMLLVLNSTFLSFFLLILLVLPKPKNKRFKTITNDFERIKKNISEDEEWV